MKIILLSLLLFSTLIQGKTTWGPEEIDKKVSETLVPPATASSDLSWITDENRPLVIANLKKREGDQYEGPYIKEALVRAGHWDTILGLIEDLKDPMKDTEDLWHADEKIIPYLMPLVYKRPVSKPSRSSNSQRGDVIRNPPRFNAICLVLANIQKCEAFPQKTRKWAEELQRNGIKLTDEAWVALITSWWEHNQDAILEKRYKDAKWLPTYKGVPINRTPEEIRQIVDYMEHENAKRLAMRTSPADPPGVLPRSSTPKPWEKAVENAGEQPSALLWIGIGAIATAAGGFLWQKFAAKNA